MHCTNCVGLSDFATPEGRSTGTNHKDAHILQQLLKDFSMVALNTWATDLPATYRGPRHASSRIDFILTQQRDGDPTAKHVSYLQDLPQMMGLHDDHQPMLCGIPWRRFYHHSKTQGLSRMQQQTLQYHWAQDTLDWRALLSIYYRMNWLGGTRTLQIPMLSMPPCWTPVVHSAHPIDRLRMVGLQNGNGPWHILQLQDGNQRPDGSSLTFFRAGNGSHN